MNLRNLRIPPTVINGSIQALNAPATISGSFSLQTILSNTSDAVWESTGPTPVHVSYHWLDKDWNMVVFDGKRTPLPASGIPPPSSGDAKIRIDPPPNPGRYHLRITLAREGVEGLRPMRLSTRASPRWSSPRIIYPPLVTEAKSNATRRFLPDTARLRRAFSLRPSTIRTILSSDLVFSAELLNNRYTEAPKN